MPLWHSAYLFTLQVMLTGSSHASSLLRDNDQDEEMGAVYYKLMEASDWHENSEIPKWKQELDWVASVHKEELAAVGWWVHKGQKKRRVMLLPQSALPPPPFPPQEHAFLLPSRSTPGKKQKKKYRGENPNLTNIFHFKMLKTFIVPSANPTSCKHCYLSPVCITSTSSCQHCDYFEHYKPGQSLKLVLILCQRPNRSEHLLGWSDEMIMMWEW